MTAFAWGVGVGTLGWGGVTIAVLALIEVRDIWRKRPRRKYRPTPLLDMPESLATARRALDKHLVEPAVGPMPPDAPGRPQPTLPNPGRNKRVVP